MAPTTPAGKAAQAEYLRQQNQRGLFLDWDSIAAESVTAWRDLESKDIWDQLDELAKRVLAVQRDIEAAKR